MGSRRGKARGRGSITRCRAPRSAQASYSDQRGVVGVVSDGAKRLPQHVAPPLKLLDRGPRMIPRGHRAAVPYRRLSDRWIEQPGGLADQRGQLGVDGAEVMLQTPEALIGGVDVPCKVPRPQGLAQTRHQ